MGGECQSRLGAKTSVLCDSIEGIAIRYAI